LIPQSQPVVANTIQQATLQAPTAPDYRAQWVKVANSSTANKLPTANNRGSLLLVVASAAKGKQHYRVYRKGPETQQQWMETAEDPNSSDRPDTVYYVTQDQVNVWQSAAAKTTANPSERVVRHERADIDMRTVLAKLGQDPDAWRNAGFIKVNHGTAGNPVAVDSEIWTYVYDANGNAQSITRSNGAASYSYDALNRLTSDTQSGQVTHTLDYDRNGNRTAQTANAVTDNYGYVVNSNQLNSDPQGSVTHDNAGNRLSDHGGARTFEYNNAGRLFKVYESGSLVATYIYNALGQRTRKTTTSGTTVYHYDLAGLLISETSDTGAPQKDYVYLNGMPVAQIDTDGSTDSVNYIHDDHLGTPRRATDADGTVTWTWGSDAFGTTAANDDPDNDGVATIINLRFPGQYYDAETQLHYNYFRYYDPSSGRYVTSDPIGLGGGSNTYGYVGGNPLAYIDLLGLAANQSCVNKFTTAGSLLGGGLGFFGGGVVCGCAGSLVAPGVGTFGGAASCSQAGGVLGAVAGGAAGHEMGEKLCPESKDCSEITQTIASLVADLEERYADLLWDRHNLFGKSSPDPDHGSYTGHIAKYLKVQEDLKAAIAIAKSMDCPVDPEAEKWANEPPPNKPFSG